MKLAKKRKTLHGYDEQKWIADVWTGNYKMFGSRKRLVFLQRWHQIFQKYGVVTFCGQRVKTYSKIADTNSTITCPACRELFGLHSLAEID